MDRYENVGVAERNSGELALYSGRSAQATAALQMPDGDLYRGRSAAHSPDLEWFALSTRTRSSIWNLKSGQAAPLPPFDAGHITPTGVFTANLEQREPRLSGQGTQKVMVRAFIDLQRLAQGATEKLGTLAEGHFRFFREHFQIDLIPPEKGRDKRRMEVKDILTSKIVWTRQMPADFTVNFTKNAVVIRHDRGGEADDALKRVERADVRARFQATLKEKDSYLMEVLSLEKGQALGFVAIDAPVREGYVAGSTLFVEGTGNRTLAYSLETGERIGQQFGRVVAVDTVRGQVAIQNELGSISIFDKSMRTVRQFQYPRNVIYAGFDGAGKRLLVLTGEQEVFIEEIQN